MKLLSKRHTCYSVMNIINGNDKTAKNHSERFKGDRGCLNNLGIVYLREGNTHKAENLFETATKSTSHEAALNLAKLNVSEINCLIILR